MPFRPTKPYDELPLLPPNANIETKEILQKTTSAARALAELKQAGKRIPNQAVLINAIPLLEARLSSAIENIVTTADDLFHYAGGDQKNADPATKEALRYRQALFQGYQSIRKRPVSTAVAVHICQTIRNINIDIRKIPGTALRNQNSRAIIYTPPEGEELLRKKLANWEQFLNQTRDVDPLIRMAVMHYQFEAIHPFGDGNGRTGRILNVLFLIQEELLDIPILYLSRYILQNRDQYYDLLLQVTLKDEWQNWILYMLQGVEETANWTTNKIQAICDLYDQTRRFVRGKLPKTYSRDLVDVIFIQPYCRISDVVEAKIAQRQSASVRLKQLVKIGILKEVLVGREKLFIHPKYINLLTQDQHDFETYQ